MKGVVSFLLVATVLGGTFMSSAQTWTQTGAPSNNWQKAVCSADGTKLAAITGNNFIYVSTNSGATWLTNALPSNTPFRCLATSADATLLFGAKNNTPSAVDTSSDFGQTWINRTNFNDEFWSSAASSANGNVLVLTPDDSGVFISTNSGAKWIYINLPLYNSYGEFAAVSASGKNLAIAKAFKGFYLTTNLGNTWVTNNSVMGYWRAIAMSADGSKLVAVAGNTTLFTTAVKDAIYSSTDFGITWVSNNAPNLDWSSVAGSSDGSKWIAAANGGGIYISTDLTNWMPSSAPITSWSCVASSADGNKLIAAANNGGIWISHTTPSPLLNISPANDLQLSWLIPSANFVLQQSPDLSRWATVTNESVLNFTNLKNEVTLPLTDSNVFFRLKTP